MEYKEVNIDQLIWDLNSRVNPDLELLVFLVKKELPL
jgi:hypothetical protein